jgi:hypothetical protein
VLTDFPLKLHIPEEGFLHSQHNENLKSYKYILSLFFFISTYFDTLRLFRGLIPRRPQKIIENNIVTYSRYVGRSPSSTGVMWPRVT